MKVLIIGGGDIADNGIIPVVGGISISKSECNINNYMYSRNLSRCKYT